MEASIRKISTYLNTPSTAYVTICWVLNFSGCLVFICYKLHTFPYCLFFAPVFNPLIFSLRIPLHFSSHFVSFTYWEEFSNTGFSGSSHPTLFYRNQEKKKCSQCFTAPFKYQFLSVRSVFLFFLHTWVYCSILFQLSSVLLNAARK